jgi:hypothetical protein
VCRSCNWTSNNCWSRWSTIRKTCSSHRKSPSSPEIAGKSPRKNREINKRNGPLSVAMLNYQRVSLALLWNVRSKPVVVRFVWVCSLRRQTVNGFDLWGHAQETLSFSMKNHSPETLVSGGICSFQGPSMEGLIIRGMGLQGTSWNKNPPTTWSSLFGGFRSRRFSQ